jgi:hypothetical protein
MTNAIDPVPTDEFTHSLGDECIERKILGALENAIDPAFARRWWKIVARDNTSLNVRWTFVLLAM